MDIQVIETHSEEGVEWGISFDGCNPNAEDYFGVVDKRTAFDLQRKILTEYSLVSRNKPIS